MDIEIVTIGEEILRGSIVNTNAAFIGHTLFKEGFVVARQTVVSDQPEALTKVLAEAVHRSDIVITTGGLGPTLDDITRQVAAALFKSPMKLDMNLYAMLEKRYGKGHPSIEDQATVPLLAKILPNPLGSASGLLFCSEGGHLFLMPGIPAEMEIMLVEQVIPHLKELATKNTLLTRSIYLCLHTENSIDPILRECKELYPALDVGIYPGYGDLSVIFTYEDEDTEYANFILDDCVRRVKKEFETFVYSENEKKIEKVLQDLLIQRNETLVLAESCSGGSIASKLTSIPDSSKYFLGSLVCYSNDLKENLLGVQHHTIEKEGAVGAQTALEMLHGLFAKTKADWALAVTGIAGPSGGTEQKPVGTVWGSIGKRGEKPHVFLLPKKQISKRNVLIEYTAKVMIAHLWRKIAHNIAP